MGWGGAGAQSPVEGFPGRQTLSPISKKCDTTCNPSFYREAENYFPCSYLGPVSNRISVTFHVWFCLTKQKQHVTPGSEFHWQWLFDSTGDQIQDFYTKLYPQAFYIFYFEIGSH